MNRNYVKFFYSTDKRGRVRIPKQLVDSMGVQPGQSVFVRNGRIFKDEVKDSRKITADRYNNVLFKASQNAGEEFRFRMGRKHTVLFDNR